jgi:hypothetical protein
MIGLKENFNRKTLIRLNKLSQKYLIQCKLENYVFKEWVKSEKRKSALKVILSLEAVLKPRFKLFPSLEISVYEYSIEKL